MIWKIQDVKLYLIKKMKKYKLKIDESNYVINSKIPLTP